MAKEITTRCPYLLRSRCDSHVVMLEVTLEVLLGVFCGGSIFLCPSEITALVELATFPCITSIHTYTLFLFLFLFNFVVYLTLRFIGCLYRCTVGTTLDTCSLALIANKPFEGNNVNEIPVNVLIQSSISDFTSQ